MMRRFCPLVFTTLSLTPPAVMPCAHGAVTQGLVTPWTAVTALFVEQAYSKNPFPDTSRLGLGAVDWLTSPDAFTLEILAAESPPWAQQAPAPAEDAEPSEPARPQQTGRNIVKWFGILGLAVLFLPGLRRR
jgi:hypothetical protein